MSWRRRELLIRALLHRYIWKSTGRAKTADMSGATRAMSMGCLYVRVGHVTCPSEWIRALAESFRSVFTGEGEVAINDPFAGGYISRYHYEHSGIPWIQIEINRKLYLNETYFDPKRLRVDQRIIQELRNRISDAIIRFLTAL